MKHQTAALERPSYNIVRNIDAFLFQLVNLGRWGYYFCYYQQVKARKAPNSYDQTLIEKWDLDKPYWMREARRRGMAPSIWLLRYQRHCLLMSTSGRSVEKGKEGESHEFFERYGKYLFDIREKSLYFCGYAIRFPRSHETGKRQAQVKLDTPTYEQVKSTLCDKALRERYREREAIEAEFQKLPWQPYRGVGVQLRRVLNEVNRRRSRHRGFEPARVSCIRQRMRTVRIYDYDDGLGA